MRKHFLILMLMTLLPLVGWATDYEVQVTTFNGTATWTGTKPAVSRSWFTAVPTSGTLTNDQKDFIASKLQVKDITENPNYDAGSWNYQLELSGSQEVSDGIDNYTIYVNSSTTATLTITKVTDDPVFNLTALAYVNTNLAYDPNSEGQTLLSGGATATSNGTTVPVIYTLDPTAETVVTFDNYANVKATDAGDYTVYYKVAETDNYVGSDWTPIKENDEPLAKNIAKIDNAINDLALAGWTYDPSKTDAPVATGETPDITFTATYGAAADATFTYAKKTNNTWGDFGNYATVVGGHAGKYKVKATIAASTNYNAVEAEVEFTIAKATAVLNVEGVINTDWTVYDKSTHQLFKQAATATVGESQTPVTVKYTYKYCPPGGSWDENWATARTSITNNNLKKTNAGRYRLNISVEGNDDYNGTSNKVNDAFPVLTVAQADIPTESYTAPAANTLMDTDADQPLITAGAWNDANVTYGTFEYSVDNTIWGAAVPQDDDPAGYTVYARITPTDAVNYKATVFDPIEVTIAAKTTVTIATNANQTFGYGTTPVIEKTVTWADQRGNALDETGLVWKWYDNAECSGDPIALPESGYYSAGSYYVKADGVAVTAGTGTNPESQEIVYTPALVKITAGQIVASIDASSTYGGALTYTLTHKSGLSTTEAATLNANSTVKTVTIKNKETGAIVTYKDGDENKELKDVVLDADAEGYNAAAKAALEKLNAGTYTLEATAEYTPNTNYALLVSAGTLTVGAKSIAGATFTVTTAADAIVYNAKDWGTTENPIEFTVTETSGIEAADYDVAYSNNKNAGTATITLTGKRNYTGNISTTFTIKKADLTITADNFTGETAWTYGKTEPTYTVSSTGYADGTLAVGGTVVGVDDNNDETEDNLVLAIRRTSNETVGMHAGAIEPYFTKGGVAQVLAYDEPLTTIALNYNITLVKGDLQVAKSAITIKLKNNVITGTYGNAPSAAITAEILTNKANYELDNCELTDGNLGDILDVSGVSFSMVNPIENNKYEVNDAGYEFAMTGAATTNYAVTISNGTYKVSPSAIKLYAKDQEIDWSADATATPNKNVSDETVGIDTENSGRGLQCGDDLTDLVASIDIVSTKVGENDINLTIKTNANYTVTLVPGTLTVTGAATLAMTSDYTANDNWFSTIQSYNGKAVNVTITVNRTQTLPSSGMTYTWKGEEWNAFILPFDITPKQLSDAFGYAIVNVVNPEASTADNIAFKLQMSGTIPANTPFMLKNYEAISATNENNVINFGAKPIVAPTNAEVSVNAGGGWTFIGSYDKKTIDNSNSDIYYYNGEGAWKHLGANSSNTWNIAPFNAYMLQPDQTVANAREITFTFEELDGSATVIKSVSDESTDTVLEGWYTINGIKLESAPTQKGIYIKDGKKVVIK